MKNATVEIEELFSTNEDETFNHMRVTTRTEYYSKGDMTDEEFEKKINELFEAEVTAMRHNTDFIEVPYGDGKRGTVVFKRRTPLFYKGWETEIRIRHNLW